ncbi:hypothetical protein FOE78_06680 [Microlunatus elymi]|uniref:DUF4190 domain-containing protein n=1 Tax=Microlunatus elymi TaxID=2596828 RepID=A0A516PWS4_9ACTN|nr:hypothetical protein [Microlunatus elymi]QDP95633.1 hypothetical protein FOE78_06680 [Microlunatus elymi]
MASGYSPQDPYQHGQAGDQSPAGYYGQPQGRPGPAQPFQQQGYQQQGFQQQGQPYQGQPVQGLPTQHGQPYPPYAIAPEHPQGTTILVLGVVSIAVPVIGFVAWYMGHKVQREIEETGATYSNVGNINAGKIIGMIMSILSMVGIAFFIVYMIFVLIMVFGVAGSMG